MMGDTFVKPGILAPEDSKLLGRLYLMRQSGDYDDFFDWEEEDVIPLVPKVKDYISRVTGLIKKSQGL